MWCRHCSSEVSADSLRCSSCGEEIGSATMSLGTATDLALAPSAPGTLAPGRMIAGRFEILSLLGHGGMGAVYKAMDHEVDRIVALKTLHTGRPQTRESSQRLKHEVILARQVTHRNVVRIFDHAHDGELNFITMEYVEGDDLHAILRRDGKFAPERAAAIAIQICRALEAAHSEGVIHRDLKAGNVLIDRNGRAVVLDFGLARSMEAPGLTQPGAVLGTPHYMSPEQVQGTNAEERSDIFSLGVMMYEMLTGRLPYGGATAVSVMLQRVQRLPPAPDVVDPTVPSQLAAIVMKCLAIDPADRYQSARELIRALEEWSGHEATATQPTLVRRPPATRKWLLAGVAVLVLALALFLIPRYTHRQPRVGKPVTVLIADFENQTGEAVFDGSLEPLLAIALEGAPSITTYSQGQARKVAAQLRPGVTKVDLGLARLIAVREGIDVIVAATVARDGNTGYRLDIQAIGAEDGKNIISSQVTAARKDAVLSSLGGAGAELREALGDATPESARIVQAETFTTGSLDAAHAYGLAQRLHFVGKWDEAIQHYSHAIQLDPDLGRAYAGLATAYRNTRQYDEAERYFKLALAHIDRMTEREKYRTRGGYYITTGNYTMAVEEFARLVNAYPSDSAGHANLALAYFMTRDLPKALREGRLATEIYPKNTIHRNNLALYAMYAGDFAAASREAEAVIQADPAFEKAHLVIAIAHLAEGHFAESKGAYETLARLSSRGASMAAMGLADLHLYRGRIAEAASILDRAAQGDLASKRNVDAAEKLVTLAECRLLQRDLRSATEAANRALSLSSADKIAYSAAMVFAGAAAEANARKVMATLSGKTTPDPQVYAKLIEAELLLKRGDPHGAIQRLRSAQAIADIWLVRFAAGRVYAEAGAYAEASSELELCLERRGEATSVFLDDVPTYRLVAPVYYYLGRAQEGLKSKGAEASLRTFIELKKGGEDPLFEEAVRALGSAEGPR
jgi:eukaryotic-like serine/threonine-protein kinase